MNTKSNIRTCVLKYLPRDISIGVGGGGVGAWGLGSGAGRMGLEWAESNENGPGGLTHRGRCTVSARA